MSKQTKEPTATEIAMTRYEQELTNLAQSRLAKHPHLQAEAIARHYTAHAMLAMELLKMIDCRRMYQDESETASMMDDGIKHLAEVIKRDHRHDFGIELNWPAKQLLPAG